MSMNKYMHPRNIYKQPPNFQQLAVQFPEFRKHVQMDITGKVSFDFKNLDSLRALSCTLLKKDFDLEVVIPSNKLVPTIPLRLNYILWIEDLLDFIKLEDNVRGIDIGTGASCVYPLIAAKKNCWSMIATECDTESVNCARCNIEKNNLNSLIKVIEVKGDKLLQDVVKDGEEYDFCMCNPPFFSSPQELHPFFKSRKADRPRPKNAFVATVNEVVSKGGEVEFLANLVKESHQLQQRIKIYTTMVGHKSSLPELKKMLREVEVVSFKENEFCQGNTTRWGLAWTFCDYDLRKVVDPAKLTNKSKKPNSPLLHCIPVDETNPETINSITVKVLALFKGLQMSCEEVTRNKTHQRFFVTAFSNTWSHQRRKRREKFRKTSEGDAGTNNNDTEVNQTEIKSPGKRHLEDLCEGAFSKKLRLNCDSDGSESSPFFKFMFGVVPQDQEIVLEFNTCNEESDREHLNQIRQYVKNNLKLNG